MDQILDSLPTEQRKIILCCYVNATSRIQVVRITNIPNWHFERVIFSGQQLMFKAMPQALLEIHTGMMASAILSDTILCERLSVNKENNKKIDKKHIVVYVPTVSNITIEANENYTQNISSSSRITLI
ncbi:DUF1830 domain-containing protein [cyanobacterium endosymbiont of Rhopalodia gibberula]|uniref:DUF1830 domain-containing protein n=1 Tax=cyanobacterium endosymbiont of Rhopalodia gibberula TaxID=1763363 RepID=UPI000E650B08|nr:DUF1830 domain-containing protein [cyanobacterium endosymbiont of Rhopalodia gibberula]